MDFANIVSLALKDTKPKDEFGIGNLSTEIGTALKEALDEENKAVAKAAAIEIIGIVRDSRKRETELVEMIRSLRRQEVGLKAELAKINKTRVFAAESNNYLPLALAIGYNVPSRYRKEHPELMVVPEKEVMPDTSA